MVVVFHEEHGAGMPGIHMSNLYPAIHRELKKFGWSQMMILMNLRQSENIGFDGQAGDQMETQFMEAGN